MEWDGRAATSGQGVAPPSGARQATASRALFGSWLRLRPRPLRLLLHCLLNHTSRRQGVGRLLVVSDHKRQKLAYVDEPRCLTLGERLRHAYNVGDGGNHVERTGDAALVRAAARTHAS